MKLCFLVSAGGGNFKFFHLAQKKGILKNLELSVIADRECNALAYAQKEKVYNRLITYKRNNNKELLTELSAINPDIIVTNWHKIIDEKTVLTYKGKMINLHYSLLPAFKGLIGIEPIIKAIDNNCQYIGVTCHYVEEEIDGGKIISQAILKRDNLEAKDIVQKCFEFGALILLNSIVLLTRSDIINKKFILKNERFEFSPNLVFDDSCFDKEFWKELSQL